MSSATTHVKFEMEEFWRNVNSIVFKSKKQESMLRQMFKDLKIVRELEDLQAYQDLDLDIVYLTANVDDKLEVFLPIAVNETITMNHFSLIQDRITAKHTATRLTVAFMDSDSTVTYFCVTPGLLPPTEVISRKAALLLAENSDKT